AGLRLGRLKTGTPPRLKADTVDWDRLELQDDHDGRLSFTDTPRRLPPVQCHIAYTNQATHTLIRENLHRSSMFSGAISGVGPRYCPSVEDKIARFPDRPKHKLFLEPESHETNRVYVNGLSTSLPREVQLAALRSIEGLERAEVLQWGYAVEYDHADPRDLGLVLQHRCIPGLHLAGQVNGTSGYEEAAVQGFVAGVSAATGSAVALGRDEAYIGVLIDDPTSRGIGGEPYRMFSSRAEHRLLLREDNADRRLMARGRELGLVPDPAWSAFSRRNLQIEQTVNHLVSFKIHPSSANLERLTKAGVGSLRSPSTLAEILRRPN
ncbi:MAG: tRNA uridine-5-carboxymethylaminomethyl(34) synthesis enzyme MnmG, partial [Phycisphaeraceae bacterium]|nr:tRNA uridine-5-carboxymethylaminomethyl(34) synthesis enzyme MnmG [Phycisphaeraceae bacterium]